MPTKIERQIAALTDLTTAQLKARYVELCGEPPRSKHRQHLIRRIAWRLQALAEGDLSERARRRAAELANDADLRVRSPSMPGDHPEETSHRPSRDPRLPAPGTLLVRAYHRQTCQVLVREQDFEYAGQLFGSLTAVARHITGRHWNGYHFFGLTAKGER